MKEHGVAGGEVRRLGGAQHLGVVAVIDAQEFGVVEAIGAEHRGVGARHEP